MLKNVLDLLDSNNIEYVSKGDNVLIHCLNPLHNDTTPSLSIRVSDGLCHCWSCGFSANLYKLNCIIEKTPFYDKSKTYDPFFSNKDVNKIIRKKKVIKRVYNPVKVIGKLKDIHKNLNVEEFTNNIGMTREFIDFFNVKYTDYCEMIADTKYEEEDTTKMNSRICIPIYHKGRLINYECRTFNNEFPKVKYVKGCSVETLFNWQNIDKNKPIIVVEGIKDLAKIWQRHKNVVSMFHAIPTNTQIKMLSDCKEIIFFLDGDEASFKGIEKFAETYEGTLKICYDKRTYKEVEKGKEKIKHFDPNMCDLGTIDKHLKNSVLYSEYKNPTKSKEKISWK